MSSAADRKVRRASIRARPAASPRAWPASGELLASLAAIALALLVTAGAAPALAADAVHRPDWALSSPAHAALGGLATLALVLVALLAEQAPGRARERRVAQLLLAATATLGALTQGLAFGADTGLAGFFAAGVSWFIAVLAWAAAASLRPAGAWLGAPYVLWASYVVLLSGASWLLNR